MANKPSSFRVLGGDVIPTGTGSIKTEIIVAPDPYQIELELLQIAGELENLSQPLLAASAIARQDMKDRFDSETDPDGDAWIPLDEEYLANKLSMGYPEDILHRTGDLEDAATSPTAFRVVGDSVWFDTSNLPPYALIHQVGTDGGVMAGLAAQHRFESRTDPEHRRVSGGPHSNQAIGRGQATPARPFIGLSEEAETKTWALFDLWFDEATSGKLKVSSSGVLQHSVGGRFGPKVIL